MNLALLNAFLRPGGMPGLRDGLRGGIFKKAWVLAAFFFMASFAHESVERGYIVDRTPQRQDGEPATNLVAFVRSQPGPAWVASHPWLSTLAGKEAFVPMQQMGGEWGLGNR